MKPTKRIEANEAVALASDEFCLRATRSLKILDVVKRCNFDLRNISHKQGLEFLNTSASNARKAKSELIKAKYALDNILFNLDFFILRNEQDTKKVQGRIDGEERKG